MNIPALPTDNLYKFMALAGILLIVASFLAVFYHSEKSRELAREYDVSNAIARAKLETARITTPLMGELGPTVSAEALESAKAQLARSEAISKEWDLILEDKRMVLTFYAVAQLLGILLSVFGFSLWYTRVQKYQDLLLRRQATEEQQSSHS